MYHPTTRVLTVLELLQSHPQMSGKDIALRLEVDPRTVRRYIVMLQDMGIPIEAERGRYGAYRLRAGYKLPPLMFTDDEALVVTLGLLMARQLRLAETTAAEGALAKIQRVMPITLRERVQAVQYALAVGISVPASTPTSDSVVTLSLAVQHHQQVIVRYQDKNNVETERRIDPYGIAYQDGRWFVVGFCHLRQDMRLFRLDRVLVTWLQPESFIPPPNFDCLDYIRRSLAMAPAKWLIEVVLDTTLDDARQRVPPMLATLEPTSSGVMLKCYVNNLNWIAYVLSGLECSLSIREPPELRAAFGRLATRIRDFADCE